MAENAHNPDIQHEQEVLRSTEAKQEAVTTPEASADTEHDHSLHKLQESIHEQAKMHARSKEEVPIEQHGADSQAPSFWQHRQELKDDAYASMLRQTRARLNGPERSLSKMIHQPAVESVSAFTAKTVARPAGILGGGITALVGSGFVLYMSKHYGFEYNFTVFIGLLLAGFIAGVLIELFIRLLIGRKHS